MCEKKPTCILSQVISRDEFHRVLTRVLMIPCTSMEASQLFTWYKKDKDELLSLAEFVHQSMPPEYTRAQWNVQLRRHFGFERVRFSPRRVSRRQGVRGSLECTYGECSMEIQTRLCSSLYEEKKDRPNLRLETRDSRYFSQRTKRGSWRRSNASSSSSSLSKAHRALVRSSSKLTNQLDFERERERERKKNDSVWVLATRGEQFALSTTRATGKRSGEQATAAAVFLLSLSLKSLKWSLFRRTERLVFPFSPCGCAFRDARSDSAQVSRSFQHPIRTYRARVPRCFQSTLSIVHHSSGLVHS